MIATFASVYYLRNVFIVRFSFNRNVMKSCSVVLYRLPYYSDFKITWEGGGCVLEKGRKEKIVVKLS